MWMDSPSLALACYVRTVGQGRSFNGKMYHLLTKGSGSIFEWWFVSWDEANTSQREEK